MPRFKPAVRKPQDFKKTARRLLACIAEGRKGRLALVAVMIVLSAVAGTVSSMFIQSLLDDYIAPMLGQAVPDFSPLIRALVTVGAVYAVGMLSTLVYNQIMVRVAQGSLKSIRDGLFAHMQTLPIRYFDTHTHGDIMSHYTNDTDTLEQMISQSLPNLLSSSVTIITVFFGMLALSVWITLFILLFVFLMLQVTKRMMGRSSGYFVAQQKALGELNGYIEEMMQGQRVVKVFCHEETAKQEFDERNEALRNNAARANEIANIMMPVMGNLSNLQYVLIAMIGGALAIAGIPNLTITGMGTLTLGTISAFLVLSKNFSRPISQISQQMNSVIVALAGAERIFRLMDEQGETDEGTVTLVNVQEDGDGVLRETPARTGLWAWKCPQEDGSAELVRLAGDVRFFDVDFGYVPEKTVLHDVSLFAKPGQKIAFVGATGAGKTTITNLINRFYDIADGKIRYDGVNINRIRKSDLRRSLGIVLQDVHLFTGTIMDNIRYGKLEATDEECIAAAKLANAHDFITRLPDGYQTVVSGDGGRLSQGQRQLLSIARAAVADPPVMILDEATSSIDTRTEAIVQRGMDRLMQGRTVFVIAHRLSTVRNADAILVLDQGRVIERGSHDELIAQRGRYYQLYTGAFELE